MTVAGYDETEWRPGHGGGQRKPCTHHPEAICIHCAPAGQPYVISDSMIKALGGNISTPRVYVPMIAEPAWYKYMKYIDAPDYKEG